MGGAAEVRGAVKYSFASGGGVADRSGVVGEAGTDGCNGLVGATEARCSLDEAGVASDFAAATIFSADLLTAGAVGSTGIDVPAGPSTRRGLTGGGVGSARVATIGGVAGLAGGQLLTPSACTVLHQGQRTGSVLTAVADGLAATGWTAADLAAGSEGFSGITMRVGFAASKETAGFGCSC